MWSIDDPVDGLPVCDTAHPPLSEAFFFGAASSSSEPSALSSSDDEPYGSGLGSE
jgi:hypothetical protein